jgi:hypothetical protein
MYPSDPDSADTFVFAHERCAAVRNTSFALALAHARTSAPIGAEVSMTPITPRAVHAWEVQWIDHHWTGDGGWPWALLAHRFTRKPRSFHAALWSGPTLCGLCVGRVSKGRKHLTLHYMESAPDPRHPLRGFVTPLMFEPARNYGVAMGVDKLLLHDPLPGVIERYHRFGFTVARGMRSSVYFERKLW